MSSYSFKNIVIDKLFTFKSYIIYIYVKPDIGMMVRVFTNGTGDMGSIPGQVIPKTQRMVLDAS